MWCVNEPVYVWWMLSCVCECVYCQCVIGVCELDVKATDLSVSTGLNWSRGLKRTKLKKHIWKSSTQWKLVRWPNVFFYFCSVWLLSILDWSQHQSSFRNCCFQSAFPSLLCPPLLLSSNGTSTADFMWKMVIVFPLHHDRFALCIYM